jgi:hypothetical protein
MVECGIPVNPILKLELVWDTFLDVILVSDVVLVAGDNFEFPKLIDNVCYFLCELIEWQDLLVNETMLVEVSVDNLPHVVLNDLIVLMVELIARLFLLLVKFAHTTINI